jgi:hypothetical protein
MNLMVSALGLRNVQRYAVLGELAANGLTVLTGIVARENSGEI